MEILNGVCKYDSEPETIWHLEWKNRAISLGMEIEKIFDCSQRYRADIKRNMVTEVQHSPITDTSGGNIMPITVIIKDD